MVEEIEPQEINIKQSYAALEQKLFIESDRLCGVSTKLLSTPKHFEDEDLNPEDFPTGRAYYRTATESQEFIPLDKPKLTHNEMLLRRLNTARGIDHALAKLEQEFTGQHDAFFKKLREQLQNEVTKFVNAQKAKLSQLDVAAEEAAFNSILICFLNAASLDQDIRDDADQLGDYFYKLPQAYDKLLSFYRDMVAVVEPAAGMVTVTTAGNLTTTEIAKPITIKTDKQKEEFPKTSTRHH